MRILPLTATCLAICSLLASGCTRTVDRSAPTETAGPPVADSSYDAVFTDDQRMRDLLLVTDPTYGPEHTVVIAARVPETYYADGAIHMTNGRELRIVSPRSWNAYTGTAMTAQEAQEVIARAHAINQASTDYQRAVEDLRKALESHSAAAGVARAEAYNRAEHLRSQAHVVETREDLEKLIELRVAISGALDAEIEEMARLRRMIDQKRAVALDQQEKDIEHTSMMFTKLEEEALRLEEIDQRLKEHSEEVRKIMDGLEAHRSSNSALEKDVNRETLVLASTNARITQLNAMLKDLAMQIKVFDQEGEPIIEESNDRRGYRIKVTGSLRGKNPEEVRQFIDRLEARLTDHIKQENGDNSASDAADDKNVEKTDQETNEHSGEEGAE